MTHNPEREAFLQLERDFATKDGIDDVDMYMGINTVQDVDDSYRSTFMQDRWLRFLAAWQAATLAERKRCAELVRNYYGFNISSKKMSLAEFFKQVFEKMNELAQAIEKGAE
jgi:hypothetical protein